MNTMEKNKKQLITKNIINEIEKIYIEKKSFKSYDLMEIAGKSIAQYIDKNFHKKDILFNICILFNFCIIVCIIVCIIK